MVAPLETPVEAPHEEPVDDSTKGEPAVDASENFEIVSNLRRVKGIGSQQIRDLQEAGVNTISDLASSSASVLSKKNGYAVSQLIN